MALPISLWGETEKMAVLHIEKTGHVLGAVTLLGAGDALPEVASVAGAAMPVKDGLRVPRAFLATSLVAFKQLALETATDFSIKDKSLEKPALRVPKILAITAANSKVQIDLDDDVSRDSAYYARIEEEDGNPIFETTGVAKLENPKLKQILFELDSPFRSGATYNLIFALSGYPLCLEQQTTP